MISLYYKLNNYYNNCLLMNKLIKLIVLKLLVNLLLINTSNVESKLKFTDNKSPDNIVGVLITLLLKLLSFTLFKLTSSFFFNLSLIGTTFTLTLNLSTL
ncbi:hypothetical protein O9G_005674 [Rozella allomycis CSF55]|uniref:Uncharacterized protein n=1 Tax=Rozella allomycis (strain CSF55) TaxID=988480 RepID=A0A075B120_ROZAC|nr:hypothetical protein O9G_005674 [Rozella allomycis CSF55]|eukprot:EPZ34631.1 hypothetical protein O9G_005674 [Rozella allomycis CSF55]